VGCQTSVITYQVRVLANGLLRVRCDCAHERWVVFFGKGVGCARRAEADTVGVVAAAFACGRCSATTRSCSASCCHAKSATSSEGPGGPQRFEDHAVEVTPPPHRLR
jgi:hypothetical protein